jgi:hypothetical protein
MVGKNKMKDWKATVRNWIRNIKTNQNQKPQYEYEKESASEYSGAF